MLTKYFSFSATSEEDCPNDDLHDSDYIISPSTENDGDSISSNNSFTSDSYHAKYEELKPIPIENPSRNVIEEGSAMEINHQTDKIDSPIYQENQINNDHSYFIQQPKNLESTSMHTTATCEISSSSKLVISSNKGRKRKHNCIYCDVLVGNFARHLERQHTDEMEVQKFLAMDKTNPNRKKIIDKIRKEGDFCSGEAVPVQEKKGKRTSMGNRDENLNEDNTSTCSLLPCTHCRGYYAKKTLRRHVKRCFFNNMKTSNRSRPQSDGHTLMADHFGPNDPLRTTGVLKTLKADEVSLVAKRDRIICEVARKYVKSHKEKHLVMVARRYMRRLARLLIEVRKNENDKTLSLLSILHPSKFNSIVRATRDICCYDASNKTFKSPSLALQMGTLLKKAISAAYSMEIQKKVNSPLLNILDSVKKLIDADWSSEISSEAGQNLNFNRFNKPTLLPMAEDISKMKNYLDDLIMNAKLKLSENCTSLKAYKDLIEGSYCSLLLFNKRRCGELQRIPLDMYLKVQNNKPCGEFEKLLTPTEKILIKKLRRIVIRGKGGRGVPVLLDKITQEGLDLAMQYRNNFFHNDNPYLFGVVNSDTCLSGYHVFRKHVRLALGDELKTGSLTSSRLRKHLATIAQILKMGNDDLEQLATFMGHTTKTHNEWYRLPSDIYQTARVSKILLLAQKNGIDKYKGRNISELDVDGDIVESNSEDENEKEDLLIEEDCQEKETNSVGNRSITQRKKKVVLKWTREEKKVTETFFANHLRKKIAPKKKEVVRLMELHPSLFKNRSWGSIKIYVCNRYNKN